MKIRIKCIVLFALCSLLLQGCSSKVNDSESVIADASENIVIKRADIPTDTPNVLEQHITLEKTSVPERFERKVIVPDLPLEAQTADAFIVQGWKTLDSIELDFNNDGKMDLIGVLEYEITEAVDDKLFYPRILFAIASTSDGNYKLDFQDVNLIRTRDEGGVFGDPYEPLTAENNTFTIHSYGGSAWKWSEATTFRYINNDWFLINEETTYGYGPLLTHYEKYDYEAGRGFVGYNNDDFDYIENIWSEEEVFDMLQEADYDLSFLVEVESPITLMQASQRWWLAPDRLETIQLDSTSVSKGIDVNKADIPNIIDMSSIFNPIRFMDENYILYKFYSADESKEYLSVYDRHNKSSAVVAQTYLIKEGKFKDNFSDAKIYNGMLYYEELIYTNVKSVGDGAVTEKLEHTASQLVRTNLNGSSVEAVFEYNFIDENKTILNGAPYCSLGFSFVKESIMINLFNGDKDTAYYLTELDGSNARFLGSVQGTSSRWLGDLSLVGKIGESLELDEEGGTGKMYGLVMGDMIKGVWTNGEKVLPMTIIIEGWEQPNIYKPEEDLLKFEGFYEGKNATDDWGSNIKVVPIFDDLAYIETFAYANAVQNVHTGGFCGLATFDNGGLNYQADEKIYDKNETIVFRLTTEENGDIIMNTNDFGHNCGAGVNYDSIYSKK